MKIKLQTEKIVDEVIAATYGKNLTAREKYIVKEMLHSLVRLAKSEYMLEMKTNVRKLTGTGSRRPAKTSGTLLKRHGGLASYAQRQFEFNQND